MSWDPAAASVHGGAQPRHPQRCARGGLVVGAVSRQPLPSVLVSAMPLLLSLPQCASASVNNKRHGCHCARVGMVCRLPSPPPSPCVLALGTPGHCPTMHRRCHPHDNGRERLRLATWGENSHAGGASLATHPWGIIVLVDVRSMAAQPCWKAWLYGRIACAQASRHPAAHKADAHALQHDGI